MKRRSALLIAVLCTGCIELPVRWDTAKPQPAPTAAKPTQPVQLVTAEEVTDGNAQEKAQALQSELDSDAANSTAANSAGTAPAAPCKH
jgi:hypothetical protein